MKRRIKSRIPDFKNLEEEARFWETHPVTDFVDETEDVDIVFELSKPREETLILRVQKDLKEKLARVARKRGLNVSSLSRIWLMEKLRSA